MGRMVPKAFLFLSQPVLAVNREAWPAWAWGLLALLAFLLAAVSFTVVFLILQAKMAEPVLPR